MTTYALLIYRTAASSEPLPEVDEQQALNAHRELQAEASKRGVLHAAARLDGPKHGRAIRARISGHEVSDAPFIEAKEWLVGFYLLDCEDEAEALEQGKRICRDPHHAIEVRPVNWRWRR